MSRIGPVSATAPMSTRARLAVVVAAALGWAAWRAGTDEVVNTNGWASFARFWRAAADPETSATFVRLTVEAAGVTLAFAVLGTVLSIVLGGLGALVLSERLWGRGPAWATGRVVAVVPRAVHEVLWALLLVQVLGFDPLVAVIAIGVPFGAVTAKVFAETLDEAPPEPYRVLRATGAGRISAACYGLIPQVGGELLSYAFYRFECALRSAAVLGVIGVGGLGFQLDLSFETLRYGEIWTLIAALMVLSGLVDAWSGHLRRTASPPARRASLAGLAVLIPVSWRWAGVDVSVLWSDRTRSLAADLAGDLWPPRLGPAGFAGLVEASVDTVAMSILAIAIAVAGGLVLGALASTPAAVDTGLRRWAGAAARGALRALLLLMRAVPAPVWAFLFVLILFPGPWPGAVALGIYNLGVVGRLFAETFDERDRGPARLLAATGASPTAVFAYATLPAAAARLASIAVYRWEVVLRETVVVGVVGAGGLGRLALDHLAARDFAGITSVILALIVLSVAVDAVGAVARRSLRGGRHFARL